MSIPKNPETIILKNEFYPEGLKEIEVWNYYKKNKSLILKETLGREIIIFFSTDLNKNIVIRKYKEKPIFITNDNFEKIISGRTLSLHSTMNKIEKFGIIDLDIDDFSMAKKSVLDIYPVLSRAPFIDEVRIRFTGKNSFHLICYFKRPLYIDKAKILLKEFLESSKSNNSYDIEYKRRKGIVNLDLSVNKNKGGYITNWSLSTLGLICSEILPKRILNFRKENSII